VVAPGRRARPVRAVDHVFTKLFPIIAVWEVAEDHEATVINAGAAIPTRAIHAVDGPRLAEEGGR
jgi:hypothetical protein